MNFSTKKTKAFTFILSIFITNICAFNATARPSGVTLNLTPKQCVALRQGMQCYVAIEISWSTQQADDYCLFSSQQNEALKCWSKQNNGTFKQAIVANKNVQFYLKQQVDNAILQSTELEMKWVYKKNSRSNSNWRVF